MSNSILHRDLPLLSEELSTAELGDERLRRRLGIIVDAMASGPGESFPKAAGSTAALEATYRFLGNPSVTNAAILAPHLNACVHRCVGLGTVLVAHDTTEFAFSGEKSREGLGRLRTKGQQGFFGHFALALDSDETRRPLGVLGLSTIFRMNSPKRKQSFRKLHKNKCESERWGALVEEVEKRLNNRASAIHVMDREADIYELLVMLEKNKRRFVIRGQHNRVIKGNDSEGGKLKKVSESLAQARGVFERVVPLSRRKRSALPVQRKVHPPREARLARLCFAAETVELKRPGHFKVSIEAFVRIHVVHVWEIDAPEGMEPVEWWLYTTEPIDTAENVMRVVDIYRARWTIEEYFRALKAGCAYEKRQLEGKHSLLNALAVFVPIAWRLLLLRTLARSEVEVPATDVLPEKQIDILVVLSKGKLDARPTARAAMLQIAALGGHIRNNGEPGWQVLARGYEDILVIERWEAARAAKEDSEM